MDYKRILEKIKERYYIHDGHLIHHGDCDIYQAAAVYGHSPCSCGLIHDLRPLHEIAELLYPDYAEDSYKSQLVWDPCENESTPYKEPVRTPISDEDIKKLEEHFLKSGIKIVEYTEEEREADRQEDIRLIKSVFGDLIYNSSF